jgi:putative aminopeptidase FrvX
MPVTKEMIADAAIENDIAIDAAVAAIGTDGEGAAIAEHDRRAVALVALIAEYRGQSVEEAPPSPASYEPRV